MHEVLAHCPPCSNLSTGVYCDAIIHYVDICASALEKIEHGVGSRSYYYVRPTPFRLISYLAQREENSVAFSVVDLLEGEEG